ncbi:unnamed protein product [Musa acuminata subsp. burmannicoides]
MGINTTNKWKRFAYVLVMDRWTDGRGALVCYHKIIHPSFPILPCFQWPSLKIFLGQQLHTVFFLLSLVSVGKAQDPSRSVLLCCLPLLVLCVLMNLFPESFTEN